MKTLTIKHLFGILHTNIASLQKHNNALCTLLDNLNYDFKLISITETGIREFPPHAPIGIPNYSVYQTKTTTSKGGTALYVLNSLVHTERADLNQQIHWALESNFVEIEQSKKE